MSRMRRNDWIEQRHNRYAPPACCFGKPDERYHRAQKRQIASQRTHASDVAQVLVENGIHIELKMCKNHFCQVVHSSEDQPLKHNPKNCSRLYNHMPLTSPICEADYLGVRTRAALMVGLLGPAPYPVSK